jgi:hypothetical protein
MAVTFPLAYTTSPCRLVSGLNQLLAGKIGLLLGTHASGDKKS